LIGFFTCQQDLNHAIAASVNELQSAYIDLLKRIKILSTNSKHRSTMFAIIYVTHQPVQNVKSSK